MEYYDSSLNSATPRNDVSALWRELGGRVHLRGRELSPPEISERVYRWWRTQDVILIFHDANFLTEASVRELVYEFWLPLANKVKDARTRGHDHKLLMFLVDYEGCTENWEIPFVERLDATWDPQNPIRSPKLEEFSENDLMTWLEACLEDGYDDLPSELTYGIDNRVEEILEHSDGGIPELALREICELCGLDWYEESEKWLTL
ncbi:MAG: hypothetical protein F6K19_32790 [Cyanothece sp. SIO1E1]|nr:hypothetical protein [Cyanothece sp. SIO1E1]